MATLNGAKALGFDAETGSLEVGKACDMVAVKFGSIELEPMFSVISHLVYACDRSQVTDVWVAGQHVLDDRRLTTISEEAVRHDLEDYGAKVGLGNRACDRDVKIEAAHRRCC